MLRSHAVASAVALVTTLATSSAFAADTAAAQSLFSDARKLMSAGNYADACPKLEESEKLDPGMGTLYNLGDCYEHVGKTASAWAAFDEVANEARAAGQPAREQDARGRASALTPKLAHFTIDASAVKSLDGLTVTRDSDPVGPGQWGTSLPIDPGEHVVKASATGKKDFSVKVVVQPHDATVVKLPPLEDAPAAAPVVGVGAVGAGAGVGAGPETSPNGGASHDGKTQRTIGLAVAGVGVLALGTGVVFTLLSKGAEGTANDGNCDPTSNICKNQDGVDHRSTAIVYGNVASVTIIAGLVLTGGGIALWATAPKAQRRTTGAWKVTPDVAFGPNAASFGMRGNW